MALGDDFFKGYIALNGRHVKDGLVERPRAFAEDGESVVLRWIDSNGGKLRSPSYEVEIRVNKQAAMAGLLPLEHHRIGIAAYEGLVRWRAEQIAKPKENE